MLKKIIAAAACASIVAAALPKYVSAEENTMNIVIDGSKAQTAQNKRYRGAGMVSGNNSSRLLLDYKAENPEAYREILNYIFGDDGIGVNHLKIEMGSDINSSSGTEPTVKRTEDEKADVTRGAGYQLAADAKEVNPDLTLDMLFWSEPLWVTNSDDVYAARYKWYKETLDAAYETYGLKFDYVSAVRNERAIDAEWIKYLSKALKAEKDCPYDYSEIKIVAADEVCTWSIADQMANDEELLNAVDVIGSHYTSWSTDTVKEFADEYGKEVWFSEASSPMEYAAGTWRFDGNGSGMSSINGLLDVANRIITMYPGGYMTLYEYQPVVSAYYDGVTYCHKQLITANTPWSGYYELDPGFFMSLHFSQFIKKGWTFIDDACFGDGKAGGDGHAIVDAVYSCMTASDPETGDYSSVITNTTDKPITYNFTVKSLEKASFAVNVWETRGNDGGNFDENYFRHIDTITPTEKNGEYSFSYTVKPYSLVTLSTVEAEEKSYPKGENTILPLPYSDDYEYADKPVDYLSSRGNAPRYTTDEGGAFEVVNVDGNNVLMQMITPDIKSEEWGGTPSPETNFGDDRWFNYSVSTSAKLAASDVPEENYVGVGLRYNSGSNGKSGWWIQLYENGTWKLKRQKKVSLEGTIDNFDSTAWHDLKIAALGNSVKAWIDGEQVAELESDKPMLSAGRAALYSSYNNNIFDNFVAEPLDGENAYITRFDNTDLCMEYLGNWEHNLMSGFANYKRTISTGSKGAVLTVKFSGTGFAITGFNKGEGNISVSIDGIETENDLTVSGIASREVGYYKYGLEAGEHTAVITVLSGTFSADALEVIGGEVPLPTEKTETEVSDEPAENESSADESGSVSENNSGESTKGSVPIIPIAAGCAAVAAAAAVGIIAAKKKKK